MARYSVDGSKRSIHVCHTLTGQHRPTHMQVFLRVCSRGQLDCEDCRAQDTMRALDTEIIGEAAATNRGRPSQGCVREDSGNGAFEDCVPPKEIILSDIEAGYFYVTDRSGMPQHFRVEQRRGRMHFKWTDSSLCEQAYSLTRRERARKGNSDTSTTGSGNNDGGDASIRWLPPESFIQDYYIHGDRSCGERIEPVNHFDDLTGPPKRPVATHHEYCLSGKLARVCSQEIACVSR